MSALMSRYLGAKELDKVKCYGTKWNIPELRNTSAIFVIIVVYLQDLL